MEPPKEIQDIPLRVLSTGTLNVLSVYLNTLSETLMPGCDKVSDYRGLAELYDKPYTFIAALEAKSNPTGQLLMSIRGPDATLSQLWMHLQTLGRTDILRKCREMFIRDTERWHHRKPRDEFEAEEIKNERNRSKIKAFFSDIGRPKDAAGTGQSAVSMQRQTRHASQHGSQVICQSLRSMDPTQSGQLRGQSQDGHFDHQAKNIHSNQGLNFQASPQMVKCVSRQEGACSKDCDKQELSPMGHNSTSQSTFQPIVSTDDVGDDRPLYDAYINCAEDDIVLAKEMLATLESSPHNLRLFLSERQLMPGGSKYEDIAIVVEERCRGKVVVILTRHYIKSEGCQFVTNFARALDPASLKKKIIPIMYEDIGEIPRMLKGMHCINKVKDEKRGWFWGKLKEAIQQ